MLKSAHPSRFIAAWLSALIGTILVTQLGTRPASAATIYWDGVTTGNWTTLANWSTSSSATTPDPIAIATTDSVIFNETNANAVAAQTVYLNGSRTIAAVTINDSGATTISGGTVATPNTTDKLTVTGGITVGAAAGNRSILIINSDLTAATMNGIGGAASGTGGSGAVYQSSNIVTLTAGTDSALSLGSVANTGVFGYGYYGMSGGTLNSGQIDVGGRTGTDSAVVGVMEISGGTVNLTGGGKITMSRGGGSSLLNITGGTATAGIRVLEFSNAVSTAVVNVGGGVGAAALTGAATTSTSEGIRVNSQAATNTINLLGNGTLTVAGFFCNNSGSQLGLNFNGGTLKATSSNMGSGFMPAFQTAANFQPRVYGNGGTLDNSGTAITVAVPLLAPTNSGVASVAVTGGGSGYIGAPIVTFTGGTGSGATAYAVMSGGAVSSIVVTSPGNYTVAPTVGLSGGGSTAAGTLGTVSIATNSTSGGMTFKGTGVTTLSATNTYAGLTTVTAGTLALAATGSINNSSGILIAGGATFDVSAIAGYAFAQNVSAKGAGTATIKLATTGTAVGGSKTFDMQDSTSIGTLAFTQASALSLNGATLNFDVGNTTNDLFAITGAASLLGTNFINIGVLSSATSLTTGAQAYTLITAAGGLNSGSAFSLSSSSTITVNGNAYLLSLNSDATHEYLGVAAAAVPITWTGGSGPSAPWDTTASTANWKATSGGAPQAFINGVDVTFDNSGTNTTGIVIQGSNVAPLSVTFSNDGSTPYSFSASGGGITGTTGVTVSGGGSVTFNNANDYTGATTVSNGTLNLNSFGAISNSAITVSSSGSLTESAGNAITGAASLTISGANITLANANNYSGATAISSGTLNLAASSAINKSAITVSGSGNLTESVNNAISGTASLTINGPAVTLANANNYSGTTNVSSGTLNLAAAGAITGSAVTISGTGNLTQSIDNALSGTSTLTVNGPTVALTNANNYSGLTTVSAGILQVNTDGALGTTVAGTSVTGGATLKLNNVNYATAEPLSLNGTGVSNGGALTNSGGTSSFAGPITLGSNATICTSGGTLTLTGGVNANAKTATFSGSGSVTVNTTGISGTGASNLAVSGTTLNLNAASTFAGNTAVSGGGTLINGVDNALPVTTVLTLGENTSNTSGVFDLNGHQQTLAGLTTSGSDVANRVVNNNGTAGALIMSMPGSSTFGGVLGNASQNNFSLTVAAGSLTLSAANTYTGATTVNSGATLAVTGSLTSGVTVNGGGTLSGGGILPSVSVSPDAAGGILAPHTAPGGATTMNVSNALTLADGSILNFDLGTASDQIQAGSLSLAGTTTVNVTANSGFSAGTFAIINGFGANLTGGAANFTTGAAPALYTYQFLDAGNGGTAGEIDLVVIPRSTFTWTNGAATGQWNFSDANFTTGSGNVAYAQGGLVIFDDTPGSPQTVNVSGTVAPYSITVTGSTAYTFTGGGTINDVAGGVTSLVDNSTALLTMNATNGYTGGTFINAAGGSIAISASGALGTGAVNIGQTTNTNATSLLTNGTFSLSNAIVVGNVNSAITASGGTLTLNSAISAAAGSTNPTLSLNGNFVLGANNSYSGILALSAGSTLSTALVGSVSTPAATLSLGSGSTFSYTGNTGTMTDKVAVNTAATINVANSTQALTVSSVVSGGALTVTGAGTLALSNTANTISGATVGNGTANSGTLSVALVNNLPASLIVNLSGGTFAQVYTGSAATLTPTQTFNVQAAGGTLSSTNVANTLVLSSAGITGNGPLSLSGNVTLQPAAAYAYSGTLTLATGSKFNITQTGLGAVTNLIWANNATSGGGMNWQSAINTSMNITFQGAQGSGTDPHGNALAFSGALIGTGPNSGFTSFAHSFPSLTFSGTADNTDFSLSTPGITACTTTLAKTSTASVHAIGSGGTLRINGTDTVKLGGSGDFQIADDAAVVLSAGGILDLNGLNVRLDNVTGTGSILNSLASSTSTVIWGVNGGSPTYSGIIKNNVGTGGIVALNKVGGGTLTLSGTNTYSGVTTIQGGTLKLSTASTNNVANSTKIIVGDTPANGSAALDVTGVTNVGGFHILSGQTLAGHGTVLGNVTVDSGGILAPGNSAGTLAIGNISTASNLTIASGTVLNYDLDLTAAGSNDLIAVTGNLSLNLATLNINAYSGDLANSTYKLITYTGTLSGDTSGWAIGMNNAPATHTYAFSTTSGEVDLIVSSASGGVPTGSGTWRNGSNDSKWTTNAAADNNWATGIPSAADQIATFDDSVLNLGTVDLDGNKTIGGLVLNTTITAYTLGLPATTNTLTLQVTSGAAAITVTGNQSHTLNAKVITASNSTISVAGGASLNLVAGLDNGAGKAVTLSQSGAGTLTSGAVVNNGAGTISVEGNATVATSVTTVDGTGTTNVGTVSGNGQLVANHIVQSALSIGNSTTPGVAKVTINASTPSSYSSPDTIVPTGNSAGTSILTSLSIANNGTGTYYGTLDLKNNNLVLNYTGSSPIAAVRDALHTAYHSGAWDGAGLTSSSIALDAAKFTLGYGENHDSTTNVGFNNSTNLFDGTPVNAQSVLVKFTWQDDLTLDGKVDSSDAIVFGTNYDAGAAGGHTFAQGDLTYDGFINSNDAILFGTAYGTSFAQLPEPSSFLLAGLGLIGLLFVRRQAKKQP